MLYKMLFFAHNNHTFLFTLTMIAQIYAIFIVKIA